MSFSLSLDADETLLAETIERFCSAERVLERATHTQGALDLTLWRAFSAQEYLELARPEAGDNLKLLVTLVEVLGHHALPGPLTDTILGLSLLNDDDAREVLAGSALCAVGSAAHMPHASDARFLFEIEPDRVFKLERIGPAQVREGLGAEAWGRVAARRAESLEGAPRTLLYFDVAVAAQLAALARGLLLRTAEHAATRKQFGKPIAAFQAVSHPLASSHIALTAAAMLARAAACAADEGDPARAKSLACAALVSSKRAALECAYTCHQKLGAIGITIEGPAHHVTRRIRSLATRAQTRIEQSRELLLSHLGAQP
jgi:hypothetical protein